LGTTVTNQYYIHEEIKSRLNLGHTCYHSVQNLVAASDKQQDNNFEPVFSE